MNIEELQTAIVLWDDILTHHPNSDLAILTATLPIYVVLEAARKWLELQTLVAAAFTSQGDTHKHKWTKITKGAGIGGWVCAECFATDTPQGDTNE